MRRARSRGRSVGLVAAVATRAARVARGAGFPERPVALLSVLAVAVALRLYRLGDESLWLDEALAHGHATGRTLPELLVWLPQRDPNPPLYYVLLRGWTALVGTSPAAMRSLSALLGVASVVLVFLLGRRLFDDRVGLFAAVVVALSPFHVRYAQEVRMYALMVVAALASMLLLVRLRDDGGRRNAVGYVVATTVLVYTHTYGLFTVLAQVGYLASAVASPDGEVDRAALWRRWLPVGAAVAVLTAPWTVLLALRVFGEAGQTAGVESGNAASAVTAPLPGVESLGSTYLVYWLPLSELLTGLDAPTLLALAGAVVGVAGAGAAVVTRPRVGEGAGSGPAVRSRHTVLGDSRVRLLAWWALVPVVVPFALSYFVTPIFLHRYTISASLACYLLAAAGLARVRRDHLRYAAVAVLVVGLVATLPAYYATDQKEQWEEATAHVEGNADPGDLVVVSTDSAVLSYEYHASRSDLDVVPVPEDASRETIAARTGGEETVWLVVSHLPDAHEPRFRSTLADEYERTHSVEFVGIVVHRYDAASTDAAGESPG